MTSWIVTANRLRDGGVVYLRADRVWSPTLDDVWTGEASEDADAHLVWARTQENEVCDPYVLEVDRDGDRLTPKTARERIRAEGPGPTLERLGYANGTETRRRAG